MTTATETTDTSELKTASNQDVMIKCVGLVKTFKDFWLRPRVRAVDGINIEIRRGEVFGLLGPNGSGKSTTIKMILGLLHPTAGRIAVLGKRPEDVETKKMIGYLPEESYLYRFLNARETLDYYGRLFHQSRPQRQRRIDMLLEMVGLEAMQRRPVGEYSKGMQRRIGLAQALINDPHLLILDEPTAGLDPIGTRQIKDLIVELKQRGKTILLCSHLLSDVEDVTDRVAIMYGGKVRATGTIDQLLCQQELTNIQTDQLDDKVIEEIEMLLAKYGKSINRVEQPRQKLETLFLEIVEKAQQEGIATSGARSSAKIAAFLREDGIGQADTVVTSDEVINHLIAGDESTQDDQQNSKSSNSADQTSQAVEAKPQKVQQQVIGDLLTGALSASENVSTANHDTSSQASANDKKKNNGQVDGAATEKVDHNIIDSLLQNNEPSKDDQS